jgi:phage tail-like protein
MSTAEVARVPQLVGFPLRRARKLLDHAGLRVRDIVYRESDDSLGTVVEQYPLPGEPADRAKPVRVGVASRSWLEFLPALYQTQNGPGRNFLEGFLWPFQQVWTEIEEKLDDLQAYFDPYETPADFLPWLASWLALSLDQEWPEQKKRILVSRAVQLYKLRGTVRGLKLFLRIFTDVEPEIYENQWPFDGFQVGLISTTGIDTVLIRPVDRAHCFTVCLPMSLQEISIDLIRKLHAIIRAEKPAHTNYYLVFAPPKVVEEQGFMQIGVRMTLGVDTWVTGTAVRADEFVQGEESNG